VFLDGRVYVLDVEGSAEALPHGVSRGAQPAADVQPAAFVAQPFRAAKRRKARTHDDDALAAPMPATVLDIIVTPGQRVAKNDVLIVLEAMKMEISIKAPRDASVKSIACREGELVQPGVPLLELE
jgi:biotin carboxyl carrier protein